MWRNVEKLLKADWYARGGFSNPRCFRKADKRGRWSYYYSHD